MPPGPSPHVSLLNSSVFQKNAVWSKQSLWEAEPGVGSKKDWRGREDLKLSLRRKNQFCLPGSQQLPPTSGICQWPLSKCLPCPCSTQSRPLDPRKCPVGGGGKPTPCHPLPPSGLPEWGRPYLALNLGCALLLIFRVFASKLGFVTPQSVASDLKRVS